MGCIRKKKGRGCPEGQHSHPHFSNCHPIDQPHRAGSLADQEHQEMGVENTWYEKNDTTPEKFKEENPDKVRDKDFKRKPKEESKDKEPKRKPKQPTGEMPEYGSEEYEQMMEEMQYQMQQNYDSYTHSDINDKASNEDMIAYLKDIHYEEIDPYWRKHVKQAYNEAMASGEDMLDYDYDRYKSKRKSLRKLSFNDIIKSIRAKRYGKD